MKYINNAGLELTVISQRGKSCVVLFTKTNSVREANIDNIRAGKVKDLYSPSRYGVGYDGEFKKVPHWKRAKDLWSNMLKRCYCPNDPKGYTGVTVDARWHCFANFLEDIAWLDGFMEWDKGNGMELDKDEFSPDSKVYSSMTCQFISAKRNRQLQPNYRTGKRFCKETRSWVTSKV